MSWLIMMFLLIFLGAPIARAIGQRIAREGEGLGAAEAQALRARLEQTESRLSAAEDRLGSMEERFQFYERLLANPENRERVKTGRLEE